MITSTVHAMGLLPQGGTMSTSEQRPALRLTFVNGPTRTELTCDDLAGGYAAVCGHLDSAIMESSP